MREAGDVCYADVFRDGTGVVEFVRKEDMTYAVRKLDNTKFRSHEVCVLIWLLISVMDNVSLPCRGEYFVSEAQPGPSFFHFSTLSPPAGMLSFQCQVLLCPPGRDCLHSCEIRRSPQPELRKITLPQPRQPEQKPQSQRQPQSQQFPRPRPRIAPLLASSQPLSLPFLNLSTTDVLPFWCVPPPTPPSPSLLLFWPFHEFLQMSAIDFKFFPFHVPMSLWMILVCRCAPSSPLPPCSSPSPAASSSCSLPLSPSLSLSLSLFPVLSIFATLEMVLCWTSKNVEL